MEPIKQYSTDGTNVPKSDFIGYAIVKEQTQDIQTRLTAEGAAWRNTKPRFSTKYFGMSPTVAEVNCAAPLSDYCDSLVAFAKPNQIPSELAVTHNKINEAKATLRGTAGFDNLDAPIMKKLEKD